MAYMPPSQDPYGAPRRSGMPAWAIALIILGCLCLVCCVGGAAVLFPAFSQAKVAAQSARELSDTKIVSLGVAMFENDHDDKFPTFDSPDHISQQLSPYLAKYPKVLAKLSKFRWNTKLSGVSSMKVSNPAQVWVSEFGPDENGRIYFGFADNHAKRYKADQESQVTSVEPIIDKS